MPSLHSETLRTLSANAAARARPQDTGTHFCCSPPLSIET